MAALTARMPGFYRARRVITRPEGDAGEEFDRVSVEEFKEMAAQGAFALHWAAHGLLYGIPKSIAQQRRRADAVLVNLSRAVLPEAQEVFGDLIVISLTADPDVLAQRLLDRDRESVAQQMQRLGRARASLPQGDYRVIEVDNSGQLETTVDRILLRFQAESG